MTTFQTKTANNLLHTHYPPIRFTVNGILPQGLFTLAGSPKIGKSWLVLELCCAVATGDRLWQHATTQGDVLYLALEDNYQRLQTRLHTMGYLDAHNTLDRLHLSTTACDMENGLLDSLHAFLQEHPNTRLIVIDTMACVRSASGADKSSYQQDYAEMQKFRQITNQYAVTLMLVHHTRKLVDADPLNMITGSTGLTGAVDGAWILQKERRTGDRATLVLANRDTGTFMFTLRLDRTTCKWQCIGQGDKKQDTTVQLCQAIDYIVDDKWQGTASALSDTLARHADYQVNAQALSRRIKACTQELQTCYGITVRTERTSKARYIILTR